MKKNIVIFISALLCDAGTKCAALRNDIATFNHGVAFSIASDNEQLSIALSLASVIALVFVYVMLPSARNSVGITLMTAGAVGNLIDRFAYGYVVDWMPVIGMSWNCADIYLCIGGAMMMFVALREKRRQSG